MHYTTQHCTVLYCNALPNTLLQYTVLQETSLYKPSELLEQETSEVFADSLSGVLSVHRYTAPDKTLIYFLYKDTLLRTKPIYTLHTLILSFGPT